jgi:hypothetical protein
MRTALIGLTVLFGATLSLGQRIDGPVETPIEKWQPVPPGNYTVSERRFEPGLPGSPQTNREAAACPYSSLFFLHPSASIKLDKAGCQFRAYRVSDTQFHILARCKVLRGPDHFETTTLSVNPNGRAFSSATTWVEPKGAVTIRREGSFVSACKRN